MLIPQLSVASMRGAKTNQVALNSAPINHANSQQQVPHYPKANSASETSYGSWPPKRENNKYRYAPHELNRPPRPSTQSMLSTPFQGSLTIKPEDYTNGDATVQSAMLKKTKNSLMMTDISNEAGQGSSSISLNTPRVLSVKMASLPPHTLSSSATPTQKEQSTPRSDAPLVLHTSLPSSRGSSNTTSLERKPIDTTPRVIAHKTPAAEALNKWMQESKVTPAIQEKVQESKVTPAIQEKWIRVSNGLLKNEEIKGFDYSGSQGAEPSSPKIQLPNLGEPWKNSPELQASNYVNGVFVTPQLPSAHSRTTSPTNSSNSTTPSQFTGQSDAGITPYGEGAPDNYSTTPHEEALKLRARQDSSSISGALSSAFTRSTPTLVLSIPDNNRTHSSVVPPPTLAAAPLPNNNADSLGIISGAHDLTDSQNSAQKKLHSEYIMLRESLTPEQLHNRIVTTNGQKPMISYAEAFVDTGLEEEAYTKQNPTITDSQNAQKFDNLLSSLRHVEKGEGVSTDSKRGTYGSSNQNLQLPQTDSQTEIEVKKLLENVVHNVVNNVALESKTDQAQTQQHFQGEGSKKGSIQNSSSQSSAAWNGIYTTHPLSAHQQVEAKQQAVQNFGQAPKRSVAGSSVDSNDAKAKALAWNQLTPPAKMMRSVVDQKYATYPPQSKQKIISSVVRGEPLFPPTYLQFAIPEAIKRGENATRVAQTDIAFLEESLKKVNDLMRKTEDRIEQKKALVDRAQDFRERLSKNGGQKDDETRRTRESHQPAQPFSTTNGTEGNIAPSYTNISSGGNSIKPPEGEIPNTQTSPHTTPPSQGENSNDVATGVRSSLTDFTPSNLEHLIKRAEHNIEELKGNKIKDANSKISLDGETRKLKRLTAELERQNKAKEPQEGPSQQNPESVAPPQPLTQYSLGEGSLENTSLVKASPPDATEVNTGEENMAAFREEVKSLQNILLSSNGAPLAKSTASQLTPEKIGPVTAEFGDNKENKAPPQQSRTTRVGGNTSLINPELVSLRQSLDGTQNSSIHFPKAEAFKAPSQVLNTGDKSGSHSQMSATMPQANSVVEKRAPTLNQSTQEVSSSNTTNSASHQPVAESGNGADKTKASASPQPAPEMAMSESQVPQPNWTTFGEKETHDSTQQTSETAATPQQFPQPRNTSPTTSASSSIDLASSTKDESTQSIHALRAIYIANTLLGTTEASPQPAPQVAKEETQQKMQAIQSLQKTGANSLSANFSVLDNTTRTEEGTEEGTKIQTQTQTPKLIDAPKEAPNDTPPSPQNPGKNSNCSTFLSSAYNSFVATFKAFKEALSFSKKSAVNEAGNRDAKPSTSMTARFWEALTSMVPNRFKSNSNSGTSGTEPLLAKDDGKVSPTAPHTQGRS